MHVFHHFPSLPSDCNQSLRWKKLLLVAGLLLTAVLLSSCYTTSGGWASSGDFENKDFYISEIVVSEAKPSTFGNWITTENVATTPPSNWLSSVLHQYAAAYNKLKGNSQVGLRLKVRFITNYAATSAGGGCT